MIIYDADSFLWHRFPKDEHRLVDISMHDNFDVAVLHMLLSLIGNIDV